MRRMTLLFGTVCALSVGTIGAVVACGGDDTAGNGAATNTPDGAAGGETGAATSSSGASGGTSGTGTSSSSGGPTDGGTSSSSGDLPSNPAQYTCGETTCDAGVAGGGGFNPYVCCQAANDTNTKCATRNTCDNTGANGNLRLTCDETADCTGGGGGGGGICCYVKDVGGGGGGGGQPSFTATCLSRFECRTFQNGQPPKPRPQLCKTAAECGDAGACNPKTCDGFKLHVCGSPDGCQ